METIYRIFQELRPLDGATTQELTWRKDLFLCNCFFPEQLHTKQEVAGNKGISESNACITRIQTLA